MFVFNIFNRLVGSCYTCFEEEENPNALNRACKDGNIRTVKELLKHPKIDPNNRDSNNHTPLFTACNEGNLEIVRELLKHPKIDLNKGYEDLNPLFKVCEKGDLRIVKELLKHPDIDLNKGYSYYNPLFITCNKGFLKVVKKLLEHPKIDPNKDGTESFDPLTLAYLKGNLNIVKELLKHPKISPKHDFIRNFLGELNSEHKKRNYTSLSKINGIFFQMIMKTKKKLGSSLAHDCFEYALIKGENGPINKLARTVIRKLFSEGVEISLRIRNNEKFKKIFALQLGMFFIKKDKKKFLDLKVIMKSISKV